MSAKHSDEQLPVDPIIQNLKNSPFVINKRVARMLQTIDQKHLQVAIDGLKASLNG